MFQSLSQALGHNVARVAQSLEFVEWVSENPDLGYTVEDLGALFADAQMLPLQRAGYSAEFVELKDRQREDVKRAIRNLVEDFCQAHPELDGEADLTPIRTGLLAD